MMTLRQKRLHEAGLTTVASAPRRSWLGRFTPLTRVQTGWVTSLLTIWGQSFGGNTREQHRLANNSRFFEKVKATDWTDAELERITEAMMQARKEGYSGIAAFARAKAILWPISVTEMINQAERDEDAAFIEQVMLNTFKPEDPVYLVGIQFYTTRKKISDISRDLMRVAPWLTEWEARKRVRWCLEIFRAKTFLAIRRES